MNIRVVMEGIIALFLIMTVGVYGSKKNIITAEINKGLTDILLKITLPLLVVTSFSFTYDDSLKANVIKSFYYSFFALVVCGIISYIFLLPLKNDKKYIIQFANVFSNCGFIGFPIINSIFGAEGVIYTSIFNMFFTIGVWTYGVMLFTGKITKNELKKVMLSPAVIAVYIGIILMIFNIQIPNILLLPMKNVASMTSPLSMIIIGVILSNVKIKEYLKDWTIYYGVFTKLIIMPLSVYLALYLIGDIEIVSKTMIIIMAMPAAAMTSIFAEGFNKDKEYASVIVFVTTLFSIITLPIFLKLIS